MPADPGDGERYAARVARLIDATEEQLLRALAALLRENASAPDWAMERLRNTQRLLYDAQRLGRPLTDALRQAVEDAVLDSLSHGVSAALNDLPDDAPTLTGYTVPKSRELASSIGPTVDAAVRRMPILLQAVYERAVHAGAAQVLGGTATRLRASQAVLDELLSDGIRGYTDRAGRNWSLDTYVEMATRTVTGQAATLAYTDQLQHAGHDLVIVSDSPRECPLCRPWEGRVLSIGGRVGAVLEPSATTGRPTKVIVAGTVDEAKRAGLQHPNCRHRLNLYQPGATAPARPVSDEQGYYEQQRQRQLERYVRKWKRRQALALDDDTAAHASRKVRDWQRELREHADRHGLKRVRYREQVGAPGAPLAH